MDADVTFLIELPSLHLLFSSTHHHLPRIAEVPAFHHFTRATTIRGDSNCSLESPEPTRTAIDRGGFHVRWSTVEWRMRLDSAEVSVRILRPHHGQCG